MIDSMLTTQEQEVIDKFYKYWRKLERAGTVSGFDRIERMAISIFAGWILEHYTLQPKEKSDAEARRIEGSQLPDQG